MIIGRIIIRKLQSEQATLLSIFVSLAGDEAAICLSKFVCLFLFRSLAWRVDQVKSWHDCQVGLVGPKWVNLSKRCMVPAWSCAIKRQVHHGIQDKPVASCQVASTSGFSDTLLSLQVNQKGPAPCSCRLASPSGTGLKRTRSLSKSSASSSITRVHMMTRSLRLRLRLRLPCRITDWRCVCRE